MSVLEIGPGVAVADASLRQKYIEERNKRIRPEGPKQFLKVADSAQFKYLDNDPWVDHDALNRATPTIADGDEVKFLIVGAGFGGLLFAVHLIEAGFNAADIRIIDTAGGFGGTWYWNRYPGLMCDIESYIYMPLLEETGYMPKHKYSYGSEIREHTERIANHWGFADKALFRTQGHRAAWDDVAKRWNVHLIENRGPAEARKDLHVKAQYLLGEHFHTSRWNYDITGGSQTDPTMEKLKDKRVGVIGTGATAVQVVPQLAKWAKHLYVFQRTPASVDIRGQHPTDSEEWKNITSTKGWQRIRSENFNSILINTPDGPNLVDDQLTRIPSYTAILGGPSIISPEQFTEHVARLHAEDLERTERIRARTSEVVKDPAIAEKLKHWYPAWCKRPTFHDDYLPAFNLPNVTLVDTDGKGVSGASEDALLVDGTSYPLDVLVLGTGYSVNVEGGAGSPGQRAGMKIVGRDGMDLEETWLRDGAGSLHGVASHGFPNLFYAGTTQTGVAPNFTFTLVLLAGHVAHIIAETEKRVGRGEGVTIEVSKKAQDEWVMEVLKRAGWFVAMSACTPSYFNREGTGDSAGPAERMKVARGALWGEGIVKFTELIRAWQKEGELKGFEVEANM
ncbi:Phenylacetone monooxygenase [Favolaschia claudopus]|uniref:Phenylacetone monooxygenase n=1 Tax=Favolaschia claudopus TaxID=2862362 RepID=A0AAW0AK18_9AGAR